MVRALSVVALATFLFSFQSLAGEPVGKFTLVKGRVYIIDSSGKKSEAKIGDSVQQSDSVEAEVAAVARLTMVDSNLIDIYPKSKLKLAQYIFKAAENKKNVRLELDYGKIKSTVNQKYDGSRNTYDVKTPSVVAGVRGTVFLTGFDPINKVSEVVTLKGLVAVAKLVESRLGQQAPPTIPVKPNQKIEASEKIDQLEIKDLNIQDREKIDRDDKKLGLEVSANVPMPLPVPQQVRPAKEPSQGEKEVVADLKKEQDELRKNKESELPQLDKSAGLEKKEQSKKDKQEDYARNNKPPQSLDLINSPELEQKDRARKDKKEYDLSRRYQPSTSNDNLKQPLPIAGSQIQPLDPNKQVLQPLPIEPIKNVVTEPTKTIEPVTTVTQPVTTVIEPVKTVTEPVTTVIEPVKTVIEPVTTVIEPVKTVIEPVTTVIEPVKTVIEPVTTVIQPIKTVTEPVLQPVTTITQPLTQPITTTTTTTTNTILQPVTTTTNTLLQPLFGK